MSDTVSKRITIIKDIEQQILRDLNEYVVPSKYNPEFKPKTPWSNVAAEKFLKSVGGKPIKVGINPHSYEIDVDGTDRVYVYSDGDYRSTNQAVFYGWKYSNGALLILNKPGGDKVLGKLVNRGGKAHYIETETSKKEREKKAVKPTESVWDTIQTVLDWAGLIPVIGDAIDIINAAIYFARGKYFDGFLSIIAVIPIVGSVIKLGAKNIIKAGSALYESTSKLIKLSKNPKYAEKLWISLMNNGVIKPEQLKDIGSGIASLQSTLKSSYSGIKRIPLIDSDAIIRQLDDFADWMRTQSRAISDLSGASIRAGKKTPIVGVSSAMPKLVTQPGLLRKFANIFSGGTLQKFIKMPWWPEKKLAALAQGVTKRFTREMADPTKLVAMIKTTPGSDKVLKRISVELESRFAKLPLRQQDELTKKLIGYGVKNIDLSSMSSKQLRDVLSALEASPAGKGLFDFASNKIINHTITNDGMMWNLFKTDTMNNLYTVLSKDMIDNGASLFSQLNTQFAKQLDIIWNELEELGADFGIGEDEEGREAVVYPLIKSGIKQYLGPDKSKEVKQFIDQNIKDNPWINVGVKTVKGALGAGGETSYNPDVSKSTAYKK